MDDITISLFNNVISTEGLNINVEYAIQKIRGNDLAATIKKLRHETDKKTQDILKRKLPAVTWSGCFQPTRAIANLKLYSGLICMDFDTPGDVDISIIKKDKYTCIAFVSPRGVGFKVVVRVPILSTAHGLFFAGLEKYYLDAYGLVADPSGKDVSRLCFLSHYEDLFYNPVSQIWEADVKKKEDKELSYTKKEFQQLENTTQTLDDVWRFTENKISCMDGQRNKFLYLFCCNACRKGFAAAAVEAYCLASEDLKTQTPVVIKHNVKRAYDQNAAEFGRFAKKEKTEKVSKTSHQPPASAPIGAEMPPITPPPTVKPPKTALDSNSNSFTQFWSESTVEEGKGSNKRTYIKYSLRYKEFCRFLGEAGFYRMHTGPDAYQYVYYKSGIITPIQPLRMKDYVIKWCDARDLYGVEEMLRKGAKSYFISQVLDALPYVEINLKVDTEEKAFFYYKNCWISVTGEGVTTHSYDDLDGDIWQASIIDRDFTSNPAITLKEQTDTILKSEYAEFIFLAAHNKDEEIPNAESVAWERFRCFCAAYGYLLHGYKNYSNAKMIVAIDYKIGEKGEQNGGSGKSLAAKGLGYMKKLTTISGKEYKEDYPWKWELIDIDTQIVNINDAKSTFNIESIFEVITEDWQINKRHVGLTILNFDISPKIYFSTNAIPRGDGASFRRRMHIIEYSDFFHDGYRPYDYFGHNLLAKKWGDDQWNQFDNFMVQCCSLYLSEGLLAYPNSNFNSRKLVDSVVTEFVDWMEGATVDAEGKVTKYNVEKNHLYRKDELFDGFNPIFQKFYGGKLTPHKFTKWFKQYCTTKGFTFNPHKNGQPDKRNGQEYYVIGDANFSIDNLKAGGTATLF